MDARSSGAFPASTFVRTQAGTPARAAGASWVWSASTRAARIRRWAAAIHSCACTRPAQKQRACQEVFSSVRPVGAGELAGLCWAPDDDFLLVGGRIAPGLRYTDAARTAYLAALDLAARLTSKTGASCPATGLSGLDFPGVLREIYILV
jgi:hypothetical protein